ncbi:MAG TPA: biopolymer transporter TolR, partial [Blastocatellia bacterium]|nr:biopolymer transporter TolR [Blastocatellia bacterium]
MKATSAIFLSALAGLAILAAIEASSAYCQQKPTGLFEGDSDVGTINIAGSTTYDAAKQAYTIRGSGANMWLGHDDFHFLWKRMKGNFILTARAEFIGKGVEEHRKIGWIVRSSLDPDSPMVDAVIHGNGLTSLQFRRTKAGQTEQKTLALQGPDVVQLERRGGEYIMSAAKYGDIFTTDQISDIDLGDSVYVGLFVCSHNKGVAEQAVFDNVRITVPAKDNFVPYHDYIGSDLEVMDVANGARKVLYEVADSLQAPNWTRDGKALIYNRNGKLYRFDLKARQSVLLNTGAETNNNNDHVLSFDGKMLGISNGAKDDGGRSNVYTVSSRGGEPKRITVRGPSYLHSWSPDGKYLIFTGERDGDFDIYRIPARGGEEHRLTTAKGLDDGPEYSPDGKHVYFNSARNGKMQLFRMNADGSDQQQITN